MYKRRTKPIVTADYIVGLTDGEGCFYALVRPPYSKKGGARVELKFFIKVQESDKQMLEAVCATLGCGAVYFQKEKRSNHAQCWRYTVGNNKDIFGTIIPFFKKHLLLSASKAKNFEIFCRIGKLVQKGKHYTTEGIGQIKMLKAKMNSGARVVREIRTLRGNAE